MIRGFNMRQCILCNEKAGILSKKCRDGYVCKKCGTYLPKDLKWESRERLMEMRKENQRKSEIFTVTNKYGDLYIDTVNSMYCVTRSNKSGKPTKFDEIHYINELKRVGLYCTNVRNVGTTTNDVRCDVKFMAVTNKADRVYDIKTNIRCNYKVNGKSLDWEEPADFQVFRSIFDNLIKQTYSSWNDMCNGLHSKNYDKAYGILFLDEDATKDDIKKRRNQLVKIFHPDNGKYGDIEIVRQINDAYEILNNT